MSDIEFESVTEFNTEFEMRWRAGDANLALCWNCTKHKVVATMGAKWREPTGALVPAGAGACFDCIEIRSKLERDGRLSEPIYQRLQWAAAADKLVRDATLDETQKQLEVEKTSAKELTGIGKDDKT